VLNKNAIPYDPQPASIASGVRVGTPSVTTQGMTEGDMKEIGSLIGRAVRDADGSAAEDVRRGVQALVDAHPAYGRPEPIAPTSASTAGGSPQPS
jgi:glycine hydroxymethyltransferase